MRDPIHIGIRRALIIAMLLSGCFQDQEVSLPQLAATSSTGTVGKAIPVTIARPIDARLNVGVIGRVVDAQGNVVSTGRSLDDIAIWTGNGFASALAGAGFRVEQSETIERAPTQLAILLTVEEATTAFVPVAFHCEGEARVITRVSIYRGGEPILKRTYSGVASASTAGVSPTSDEYQQPLMAAVRNMLDKAIPDLTDALSRASSS